MSGLMISFHISASQNHRWFTAY